MRESPIKTRVMDYVLQHKAEHGSYPSGVMVARMLGIGKTTANYYINCLRCKRFCSDSKEVQRMAKCEFCDKGVTFGIKVSHSHRRSNRPWKPNVKRVKAVINGTPRHVYVCTRCLRSGKVTRAI